MHIPPNKGHFSLQAWTSFKAKYITGISTKTNLITCSLELTSGGQSCGYGTSTALTDSCKRAPRSSSPHNCFQDEILQSNQYRAQRSTVVLGVNLCVSADDNNLPSVIDHRAEPCHTTGSCVTRWPTSHLLYVAAIESISRWGPCIDLIYWGGSSEWQISAPHQIGGM